MQWGYLRLSTPPCAPCVDRRVYFSCHVSVVCRRVRRVYFRGTLFLRPNPDETFYLSYGTIEIAPFYDQDQFSWDEWWNAVSPEAVLMSNVWPHMCMLWLSGDILPHYSAYKCMCLYQIFAKGHAKLIPDVSWCCCINSMAQCIRTYGGALITNIFPEK